ncbi:MAG: flagellar biosynthetic protein FliQ [Pseudomonadota bacterium]
MTELEIIDVTREALWLTFIVALPTLTLALIVGVSIGLFQALTSIQEMTLTFVPKLAAVGITFWITMGFMAESIVTFFQDGLLPLIAGG